jgi:hypothetical protein
MSTVSCDAAAAPTWLDGRRSAVAAQPVLQREPPENGLPAGQSVLVDDGSCPAGQIKKVVGRSQEKRTRRQRSCVMRAGQNPPGRPDNSGY